MGTEPAAAWGDSVVLEEPSGVLFPVSAVAAAAADLQILVARTLDR